MIPAIYSSIHCNYLLPLSSVIVNRRMDVGETFLIIPPQRRLERRNRSESLRQSIERAHTERRKQWPRLFGQLVEWWMLSVALDKRSHHFSLSRIGLPLSEMFGKNKLTRLSLLGLLLFFFFQKFQNRRVLQVRWSCVLVNVDAAGEEPCKRGRYRQETKSKQILAVVLVCLAFHFSLSSWMAWRC